MKQEAVISNVNVKSEKTESNVSIIALLQDLVFNNRVVAWFATIFSAILGEKVSNQHAFHLIHAQFAFAILFLNPFSSLLVEVLVFAWFCIAVLQCRRDRQQ